MRLLCVNSWVGTAGTPERDAALPRHLLRDSTTLTFVAAEVTPQGDIASQYEAEIMDLYVARAVLEAGVEDFDAVIVDSISDPAVEVLRSRLDIPVVGAGLSSYLTAILLGRRFAIVSYMASHRSFYERILDRHGLTQHCVAIVPLGDRPYSESPEGQVAQVEAMARAADQGLATGADVIVLGSVSMHRYANDLRQRLDVPIIDPTEVAIADAERLVVLRLAQSKLAYPAPRVFQDEVWRRLTLKQPELVKVDDSHQ